MKQTRIALTISPQGRILHVLEAGPYDDVLLEGVLMLDLVPPPSRAKAQNFLTALVTEQRAFRWVLPLLMHGQEVELEFSGIASPELVVIAMEAQQNPDAFLDGLMDINNEQANAIRSMARELAQASRPDDALMEMSKLNNELASAQRELARRNAELRRLNEEKNRILGMVAHDLRNPIGVVASYGKLLKRGKFGELNERQQEILERMVGNCFWMLSMVEELVDLTAIESGTVALACEDLDLERVVRDCIELASAFAEEKQISIVCEVQSSGSVWADRGKLLQVMTNLLTNAIKYSAAKTTTTITIGTDGQASWVSVSDEGQGIAPDKIDELFQPFSTVGSKATGGEKSTGLGLAIVRRIVQAHGGGISVTSELGQGSTFRLDLPSAKPETG